MSSQHIKNPVKVIEMLTRFTAYVHSMDGKEGPISFRDSAGILGREEDYKSRIAEEARKESNVEDWKESWIGSGKIAECAKKAMSKAVNIVNINQQFDFSNRLDPSHSSFRKDAERVLYDIYRNPLCKESDAFSEAIDVFGAKYDTIAYLFFIKDPSRFLPISTGHFDKGFSLLDIDYTTSYKCSWENYEEYNEIIREILLFMEEYLSVSGTLRLIDAHSFIWIIQEDKFINWNPDAEHVAEIEKDTEDIIQGVVSGTPIRRQHLSSSFTRSAEVVKATKTRAKGICQYCGNPAPFNDKKGNPYLEVHHIIWLSRGGEDSTDNTVALCPNCHTRMHILDDQDDIMKLQDVIKNK